MQNEVEREKLFNDVNPISRSDIDLEGSNVSSDVGLGNKYVIDRLLADFILLEFIDINNGEFVDEDGFVVVKKESKQWRKAVVRCISPWSAQHFQLKYGDTVLLPDDKGLKIGVTQYEDPDGNVHKLEAGAFVNGLKILGTLKTVK
jgi:hypothetical protein